VGVKDTYSMQIPSGGAQCVCQRHVAMEVVSLSEENMACSKLEAEWGVYRGAAAT